MSRLSVLAPLPRYLTVFVNWACNLSCRECWLYGDSSDENAWLEEVKREQITLELWNSLLDEVASGVKAPSVSIMGGEPLMHAQILDLVREAKTRVPGLT